MSEVMLIGEYQLANLQRHMAKFLFLDLRAEGLRQAQGAGHWLLANALPVSPDSALDVVRHSSIGFDHPIVILCENGSQSESLGRTLSASGYLNVFAIMGGSASLLLV